MKKETMKRCYYQIHGLVVKILQAGKLGLVGCIDVVVVVVVVVGQGRPHRHCSQAEKSCESTSDAALSCCNYTTTLMITRSLAHFMCKLY
jgi:hypothetical protein